MTVNVRCSGCSRASRHLPGKNVGDLCPYCSGKLLPYNPRFGFWVAAVLVATVVAGLGYWLMNRQSTVHPEIIIGKWTSSMPSRDLVMFETFPLQGTIEFAKDGTVKWDDGGYKPFSSWYYRPTSAGQYRILPAKQPVEGERVTDKKIEIEIQWENDVGSGYQVVDVPGVEKDIWRFEQLSNSELRCSIWQSKVYKRDDPNVVPKRRREVIVEIRHIMLRRAGN